MSDITLSSAVRSNLLSLQNTSDLLAKTQERLATGLEVNSALDNPTNFFTASSLNSRASDLSRLLDSVSNATQTLEAADNGITAITSLVESAQASARQALQAPGQVTESKIEGGSGATFNPAALSSITGDNNLTGALDADAPTSADSGTIAADATIGAFSSADISGATNSATALDANGVINENDTITFNVDGTTLTVNFVNDASSAGDDTGPAVAGVLNIDTDATVAETATALNTALGAAVTVGELNGTLTFTAAASTEFIEVDEGDAGALGRIGLDTIGVDSNTSATSRLVTQNADLDDLVAVNDTLEISTVAEDGTASSLGTITFGTGANQVSNKSELIDAINALSGVEVSAGTAGGADALSIDISDDNDATTSLRFTGADNNALESVLGFTPDTTGGAVATAAPTNLLNNQAGPGVQQGDTLTIQVGNSTELSVTFGTGANQVSTLAELNSALQGLAGGAASVDTDGIDITADNAGDTIVIGGSDRSLAAFGLRDADVGNVFGGESNSLIDGTDIDEGDVLTIQVGTNNALNITFGTNNGEVNSLSELEDTLSNLAGGRASIDSTTGAITIEATQGTDTITVTSTDNVPAAKNSVAEAFGLTNSTTPVQPVTTDSATRAEARSQYNELLIQIDELSEDSGFNGVNLLNGDDLTVIFNEDGSSTLDINGVNFDSSSLGLSRLNSGAFQQDSNINATLDTLDTVINTLRSQASKFGSNLSVVETREDFTKATINTLETGAANLTLADSNEEGANLLALQTRQSLSTTALSLSSQADQNVLRLF